MDISIREIEQKIVDEVHDLLHQKARVMLTRMGSKRMVCVAEFGNRYCVGTGSSVNELIKNLVKDFSTYPSSGERIALQDDKA